MCAIDCYITTNFQAYWSEPFVLRYFGAMFKVGLALTIAVSPTAAPSAVPAVCPGRGLLIRTAIYTRGKCELATLASEEWSSH